MRKIFLYIFTTCICFLTTSESNAQSKNAAEVKLVEIKKADLFSYQDIKPLIAIAFPGKDYTNCTVQSFNLSCSATEGGNLMTFIENNRCDKLTEKQISLIEKYGKDGMVFTLEGILMIEHGKPGTPYDPTKEIVFSVPDFLVTIKE